MTLPLGDRPSLRQSRQMLCRVDEVLRTREYLKILNVVLDNKDRDLQSKISEDDR
jgi:hypothetical protein